VSTAHAGQAQAANPLHTADAESGLMAVFHDMPAWGLSLVVHLVVLTLLASYTFVTIIEPEIELTSEAPIEEVRQEEFVIATEPTETVGSQSDLNIIGPSMAAAQNQGMDNHREQLERLEERLIDVRLPDFETMPTPNEADLLKSIDLTGSTEHAGGTEGAIDRITQEIAASLRQRKTLVVWLFDESLSLEKRREAIAERFESIYRQLGILDDVDTQDALKTGMIGYGQNVHVLLKEATSDIDTLLEAVGSIKNDTSGEERVFTALGEALRTYLPTKRKMRANMMVIAVTDERGDDYQMLEEAVRRCTREGVRVYCIGNTSVFGREKGYVRYAWEYQGEQFEEDIEVDQGPETAAAEGLQLPFWTTRARGLERMSSGYGPYTLSRLCSETGGIFFIADETPGRTFDASIMRQYGPDYRPLSDYQRELATNSAKAALVNAARQAIDADVPVPRLSFQANNDNVLREQITEAQRPAATFDYFLQNVHAILDQGERDRGKLDSDRWRASFDLAMGRILAMRVRAYGYNAVLAEMKSMPRPFQKSGSNLWRLEPSDEIDAGATVRRMHDKALEYLNRVIEDHPGTPWAFLAQVELSDPLGWRWVEGTMQIAQNNGNNGNNGNNPQFAPEEEARRRQQQQRRQMRDISRPKL
jgi:hypothetical protein